MKLEFNKVKIIVTAPIENITQIRNAVCKAGAGVIGNYSLCTFSSKGIGTFMPNENASPFIGVNNKLEFVEEEQLQFICEIEKVKKVLITLKKAHPYEEPAIDIFPLIDEDFFL